MTEMKRVTVAVPEDLDRRILELKKNDAYIRCSYGEIVRRLVSAGLEEAESQHIGTADQKGA